MKQILLMSDNHGDMDILDSIQKINPEVDLKIHCGDSQLFSVDLKSFDYAVRGNCDFDLFPIEEIVEIENKRILITHGHKQYVSNFSLEQLVEYAKNKSCNLVFFGHTHCFCNRKINDIQLINPGALSLPRDKQNPSYCLITIDGDEVEVRREFIYE